jgi:hypothetical protein
MPEHARFRAAQTSEALAAGWAHHWNDEQDLDQVQPVIPSAPIKQLAGYESFNNTKDFTIVMEVT